MNVSKNVEATDEVQGIERSKETDREVREAVREAIDGVGTGSIRSGNAPTNTDPSDGS